MTNFWEAFWPNFASTILGLLLGLPLAFWTDRQITAKSERVKREEEKKRLVLSLTTICRALSFNRQRLREVLDVLSDSKVPFDSAFDYSAWDAIKAEIVQYLHDPALQQEVAYHFSQIRALAKLIDMYLDYTAGIGSAIGGVEQTRASLRGYLIQKLQNLDNQAEQLIQKLQAASNISSAQLAQPNRRVHRTDR